ncbi:MULTISPECIES: phosphoribosylanthranilate isomerase [unclassified Campylobacter]|uniref:phosphoribosylanthranilate isomerase n=1 Tax=unclassified Campylobacter TaxID=2593542 RepID=UPI0022E9AA8A|nr:MULTISPECIES: phosphoribosylanthranilate isomerase [unclassified Campylobacter]MDA3043379.1 phosphoribosylanthranilate isomerase [Campylobacter sp. JMF_09 ED2]MDA3045132.1 phosphoribosylanthranilate isomerase [Campylobacter sp. JMF_07 ED4]MDA3064268.1 phosphoribosylanthranilate isomerase [Campylobacter sp. JMF_11 EL3]MDA3072432.1 phosphoribosylanthranilate isomerase [Campylobacter sp. VBCF_03 NA9]MDA3075456.1 phosphoribosylanthranilate isomerase [Campylobacter sp. JMF_05 ED3]
MGAIKPKIKICGIKNLAEAKSVLECDFNGVRVDFLGLIFAQSPRKVTPEIAKEISNLVREFGRKSVGVFTDTSDDEILQICKFANLSVAQIYKEISPNLKQNLANLGVEAWQVVRVKDKIPSLKNLNYDKILFDYKGEKMGGNGQSFEWKMLKNLQIPFILAGGIGAQNLANALKIKPFCLDINSKAENENSIKNPAKIMEILKICAQ